MFPECIIKTIMGSATKSCSLDPIPSALLKNFLNQLVTPITSIINMSLKQGEFLADLKHALVTLQWKKSSLDPEVLKNYRPISNLVSFSSCFFLSTAAQLNEYLLPNNIFSKMQSAYRPNHSTETALLCVYNDINLALDQHDKVILVLLDLSSAFDTIDHTIVIERLQCRESLNGIVLKWFQSYLLNRTQSVVIDGTISDSILWCSSGICSCTIAVLLVHNPTQGHSEGT